jgi:hypothetical protein
MDAEPPDFDVTDAFILFRLIGMPRCFIQTAQIKYTLFAAQRL